MKTLVLGTGRSGLAAATYLLKQGRDIIVSDNRDADSLAHSKQWDAFQGLASQYGDKFQWALGGHPLTLLEQTDEIVISPGISLHVEFLSEALRRKKRVLGEMELAYSACPKPIVAVTGTNGKSTTCSVLGEMFDSSAVVGGNIGIPLLDQVQDLNPGVDWVVAEVSSFQLETVHHFRPKIGILTNVSPDHLDHHKDLDEYRTAKSRMFAQMGPEDVAIFCEDDESARLVRSELEQGTLPPWIDGFPAPKNSAPPRILTYSARVAVSNGIGFSDDEVGAKWVTRFVDGEAEKLFPWDFPGLPGLAMMSNGLAAVAAALEAGLSIEKIQVGLRRFQPLRYRMELAGTVDGVDFVNDSKATNIESALASAQAIQGPLAVIVGGKDKGVDYAELARGLCERNGRVFLIGEAATPIGDSLRAAGFSNMEESSTMGQALLTARDYLASTGGTVLLAPACSSFDQFNSAEQRGQIFNEMVSELKARGATVEKG